jgi:hypothetical protein
VFEPPGREQLDEIAARPLFSPTRRPFVAAEPELALTPAPASLPPLELIGVLLTEQRRAALLRSLDGGDPGWVREEDAMAGWRLQKIQRNRVHLAAGDRLEVVELRADAAVSVEDRWVGSTQQPQEVPKEEAAAEEGNNAASEMVASDAANEATETRAAQGGREQYDRASEPRRQ